MLPQLENELGSKQLHFRVWRKHFRWCPLLNHCICLNIQVPVHSVTEGNVVRMIGSLANYWILLLKTFPGAVLPAKKLNYRGLLAKTDKPATSSRLFFKDTWKTSCLYPLPTPENRNKWIQLTQLVVEELPAAYLQVKHTMPSEQRILEYWESWGLAEQLGSPEYPTGRGKDELLPSQRKAERRNHSIPNSPVPELHKIKGPSSGPSRSEF